MRARITRGPGRAGGSERNLFPAVAIKLVVTHAMAAHPLPPWRILFGKARKGKCGWAQINLALCSW